MQFFFLSFFVAFLTLLFVVGEQHFYEQDSIDMYNYRKRAISCFRTERVSSAVQPVGKFWFRSERDFFFTNVLLTSVSSFLSVCLLYLHLLFFAMQQQYNNDMSQMGSNAP